MCMSYHVSDSFRGVACRPHKFLTVCFIASLQMRKWRHLASHVEIPQGFKISSGELCLICQTAQGWDKETPRVVTLTRHATTMFANRSTGFVFVCFCNYLFGLQATLWLIYSSSLVYWNMCSEILKRSYELHNGQIIYTTAYLNVSFAVCYRCWYFLRDKETKV